MTGKLYGVMPAKTPSGCRIASQSMPRAMSSSVSPIIKLGMPHACSMFSMARRISPRVSARTLPCSRVNNVASSSKCSSISALRRKRMRTRSITGVERVRILFRLKALMEEHFEELATLLTREHGKVRAETRGEIRRAIENIEHACGMPSLMMGDTLEDIARGIDCEAIRQPLGVFAGITPYNFPVMIPCWFWPYAVATGNTFVLKPSEQDPLTHQRVVEFAMQAGLPKGVLNVVHGARDVAEALLDHPDIKGISFVGSSDVAKIVYARGAASGKRVQALGGAKNHMIVLPDADMDKVGQMLVDSLFGSTGQRCL